MKREDVLETLNAAVLALTNSENWQSWLRTRKRFHKYSFRNQVLISVQRPTITDPSTNEVTVTAKHPTHVAGFKAWKSLGYQVQKGSNGIGILAPCRPSKRALREAAERGEDEPRVRFTGANVFDISQTVPIPGEAQELEPEGFNWGYTIGDTDPELPADLALAATSLGITYVDWCADLPGECRGEYRPGKRTIAVDGDLNHPTAAAVLVHELAHHVDATLPGKVGQYNIGELVAESASFVVCDGLGLDAYLQAVPYVAHWTKDIEDPAKALSEVAGRVLEVAAAIEEALRSQRAESCMTSST